jgi:uncharacterized protein (TIGR02246 family)
MKRRNLVAFGVAALAVGSGAAAPQGSDEAMMRQALDRLNEGLTSHDPGLANAFAADGLMVGSEPGERAQGRAQIAALLETVYAQPFKASFEWKTVSGGISGDLAWLFAEGDMVLEGGGLAQRRPYRLTGILVKAGGGWTWRLFHGSEPITARAPAAA